MTEKKTKPKLTSKQDRFINEYMKDGNRTKAATRAGYSEKSARQLGSETFTKPYVKQEIEHRKKEAFDKLGITPEYIFNGFKTIAERCIQARPKKVYDRASQEYVQDRDEETGELLFEFDSSGANKAFDSLAKSMNLYTERIAIVEDQGAASRFDRANDNAEED